MGLYATAEGLTEETCFDCGYLTFVLFRIELAKAYNRRFGELYEMLYLADAKHKITESDLEELNYLADEDLDIFLTHSDCDGKFTPKECQKIYNVIKDLHMDMVGHNYGVMKDYNMLEHWKYIFKHCADRKVNLYFR